MHFIEITLVSIVIYVVGNISAQNPGDVQLYRGTNSSGVVQIYQEGAWKTICRTNFGTQEAQGQEAQGVCKQLGFQFGQLLPLTAYGLIPETDASGGLYNCLDESVERLTDCDLGTTITCGDITTLYASVSCLNEQSPITGATLRLDNSGTGAEYFSTISVARENIWGKVYGQFWTDNEANVACKQLSYTGGVASYQVTDWSMPVVQTFINCIGNETSLSDCPTRDDECLTDTIAAVVCYTSQAPSVSLVGGNKRHYGNVVFSVDGTSGLLCDEGTWTYRETTAVCMTLGYYSGYLMTGDTFAILGVTGIVLEGLSCDRSAESIFYCYNNGWRNVSQSCTTSVSVFCYSEVRLYRINQRVTDLVFYGRPEFRNTGNSWYGVCATDFTQVSADMLCREFGFTIAEISLPGNFGSRRGQNGYHSHVICPDDAASLAECEIQFGNCLDKGPDVALVCHNNNTSHNAVTFAADTQYYGSISVSRYGAEGAVCMVGWDDKDATVACRERGHHSGIALAGPNQFERITPLWVSGFSCTGTESRLEDCTYTTDLSNDTACVEKDVAAGVLCYLAEHTDQAKVRLKDGKSSLQGRAEVYNDVTGWSTICRDQWSIRDAEVFCRQAGYADGRVDNNGFSPINTVTNPYVSVVLSGIDCEGTEGSIFQCHSYGWLQVSSTCESHTRDAGVYCYEYVDLYPSSRSTFGAVLYHSGDDYGVVCKDNFDENAAKVVCREMNPDFYFSKIICCNGLGPLNYEFTISDVKCDGSETSLRDCQSNTDTPSCPSDQYVAVVCNSYNIQFFSLNIPQSQSVLDPIVKVNYFSHDGYICSEDFTQADASVVCKELGYTFGNPYKASALGLETNLRWLRGMGCLGTEETFKDCPNLKWGQIGVCSWDSVAAVMCSNNQADLAFDVRLTNGSDVAGRLEVKVKGQWGTVCGRDLTKNVATVICRSLGYHDGITKAPGHYGAGAGDVIFSALKCSGSETGFHECIWSGYNQGSSLCDHTQDAAIQCYLNMRLAGSTTVNYGRLEVFDDAVGDWSAVCDRNQHNYDATDICRQLDYVAGMFQSGSPLGNITIGIAYTTINCTDKTKRCVFTKGLCTTGRYVALYCSENVIPNESFDVRLPLSSFYGPVSVRRFGLWGHICSVTFDDNDAAVVCTQLGYKSGVAVHTLSTSGFPIIQGGVECTGTESSLEDCPRGLFADRHGCYNTLPQTVAAVLCYNEQLSYGSTPLNLETGEMTTQVTISLDDQVLSVDLTQFNDIDATVYCRNLGYPGGQKHSFSIGNHGISDIQCTGVEESIIQCPGVWDPSKTTGGQGELAGVICRSAVNLKGGQSSSNGALYVSKGAYNGLVCHNDFDEIDAGVACRNLGYDNGLSLCCTPFGNIVDNAIMDNVKCTGSEKHFTDCPAKFKLNNECEKDYAAVACYSGDLPATYSSISVSNSVSHTGLVRVRYMGIDGLICTDNWTDEDAHVVCREMGLNSGIAYSEARSEEGPYWTSNVQCTGQETGLTNCPKTQLGKVTECTNQHHAAVICYDTEGVIYSLVGSDDPRYGFVQISINGEKGNICGSNWDSNDAQVLCKMLDFRAGDVGTYTGIIEHPATGPVWDTNFRCEGTEQSLNHCVASGWRVSTNDTCARHQEDAGVFCYTSVKLSTGVGRETDQGAVLYFKDNKWHTICDEDFTDTSAKVVCQELGFLDGKARCCSSFGDLHVFAYLMLNEKVMCTGTETDVTDCLVPGPCGSTHYASVACYGFLLQTDPVTMPPPVKEPFNATPVIVAIVLFLILVLIAVALFFFVRKRRRQKKLEQSKLNFDNTIVTEQQGGNLMVQNPLHEIMRTPEVPRVHYTKSNGEGSTAINPGYQTSSEARGDDVTTGEIPGNNRTVINVNHYDNNDETNQNPQQIIKGHHDYDNPNYVLPDKKGSHSGNTEQNVVPRETTGEHVYTSLSEQAELSSPSSESKEPNFATSNGEKKFENT